MFDAIKVIWPAMLVTKAVLDRLEGGEEVISIGQGFGELHQDTEIKADRVLGTYLRDYFRIFPQIGRISIEGMADHTPGRGPYWMCIDQLDGSLNHQMRGTGIGLPYSAVFTCLSVISSATFNHVIAAGVIDLRSGDCWLVHKNDAGRYETTFNGRPARTMAVEQLDLRSMIMFGEMYYPSNRELLLRGFSDQRGWLKNPGSAAYEMACVASGTAVGFICDQQKQDVLGAGRALVLGAGGAVIDHHGKDLGPQPYKFVAQTPCIMAANDTIARQIVSRLYPS